MFFLFSALNSTTDYIGKFTEMESYCELIQNDTLIVRGSTKIVLIFHEDEIQQNPTITLSTSGNGCPQKSNF